MAKQKKNLRQQQETKKQPEAAPEPKLSRLAFQICLYFAVFCLVAQIAIAFIVYPGLPKSIPSGWVGWAQPGSTIPSWIVFLAFTSAELVVLVLTIFSPKDEQGKRVMEWGKMESLTIVAALFLLLQASAFRIPR